MTAVFKCVLFLFSKQTPMLTAQPPVCLLPSHPVTATSLMTALILSPNRDALPPPSSLSWTDRTGRGTAHCSHSTVGHVFESAPFSMWWLTLAWIDVASRQKVCCGIVYKGRFGEVIIDPRLFKPCCSSKKQKTLASTQVGTHLPNTLPPQLPEDVKPNWWLPFLNPPCRVNHGTRLVLSPVADLPIFNPQIKSVS